MTRGHLPLLLLGLVVPGTASRAATPDAGDGGDEITIAEGQTTILRIGPRLGHPIERDPEFSSKAPSYWRALEMDRAQRWGEAAVLYQQALTEIGDAFGVGSTPLLERAATKIDVERRRSQALAAISAARPPVGPTTPATPPARAANLERGRLLRLKVMAIRAGTGVAPASLLVATHRALEQAQRSSDRRDARSERAAGGASGHQASRGERASGGASGHQASRGDPDGDPPGDPEVRLLRCATRAVAGDWAAARTELAHVSRADRTDPARALGIAICEAALGRDDDAIASLAVVLDRLDPSSGASAGAASGAPSGPWARSPLLQLGRLAELYGDNDWDGLRGNPRFERLFH